jgi:hypothetical protein
MLKLTAVEKNILLLNYAAFKTIVHVLVLYQTSNKYSRVSIDQTLSA